MVMIIITGFTTAFAVLHLVTLTIKDGSLRGSDHLVQSSAVLTHGRAPRLQASLGPRALEAQQLQRFSSRAGRSHGKFRAFV